MSSKVLYENLIVNKYDKQDSKEHTESYIAIGCQTRLV